MEMAKDIGPQAFLFDHYHQKIMNGTGVACPIAEVLGDDVKVGLKDGVVISVSKDSGTAEVGFIGGDRVVIKGTNLVKHLTKD